jgi:hypothetical protein
MAVCIASVIIGTWTSCDGSELDPGAGVGPRRLIEYLGDLEPDGGAGMESERIEHAARLFSVISPVVGGGLGLVELLNGDILLGAGS